MSREKSCFGILFSLSIIIGVALGMIIRQGMRQPDLDPLSVSASALGSEINPDDPASFARTYLFIGVDNLLGKANLEGAWLITLSNPDDHPEGTIEIILTTIYPLLSEQVIVPDQHQFTKPHPAIQVNVNDLNSIEAIGPLSYTDYEWSDVIIIDEVTINTAIQLNDVNYSGPINTPTADMFIKPWENPEKAFRQQWGIITTLCTEPQAYSNFNTIQRLKNLYGDHIISTLSGDDLLKLWQVINYNQNDTIDCEIYPQLTH